jgi:prefoldin subunit 5
MAAAPGYGPYSPQMSREEELDYLKDQAEAIKGQLEDIESRMRELEAKE